jgi:hypothetical protein
MTNEENNELLKLCAEFGSASDCERFGYLESEEWRDLSAFLEREKELEKDLPAFDVPDGFLLSETSSSGFENVSETIPKPH